VNEIPNTQAEDAQAQPSLKREAHPSKDGQWRSFPKVPHLLQYVRNGNYYARIKGKGKIIRDRSFATGEADDLAFFGRRHPPNLRGIFVQTPVRPPAVVICQIPSQRVAHMSLIMHHDAVEALAPDRADEPLHLRGWTRRTRRNAQCFESQSPGATVELQAIEAVPVPQEVLRE
jgi:hypothetical protein